MKNKLLGLLLVLLPLSLLHAGALVRDGRYFKDVDTGEHVYLTGSHTWDNLQNWGDNRPLFDYPEYLNLMQRHQHNFMRMWVWESTQIGDPELPNENIHWLPWERGSGHSASNPNFDLYDGVLSPNNVPDFDVFYDKVKFRNGYFVELRDRVRQAKAKNIYVSVMLFQGFSYYKKPFLDWQPWNFHPFNINNNMNGVDGDLNNNSDGEEIHTLDLNTSASGMEKIIVNLQKSYIKKVLETLKDEDNVLYEVSNEDICSGGYCSKNWQYDVIDFIKSEQLAIGGIKHPIGMTIYGQNGNNADVFNSPADWVSPGWSGGCGNPNASGYAFNPAHNNQNKVVILDTDHIKCVLGETDKHVYRQWVWKSMLRGLNPILMDAIQNPIGSDDFGDSGANPNNPAYKFARTYQGQARVYAKEFDLSRANIQAQNSTTPSSTGYSLAIVGEQYLVYQPNDRAFAVQLAPGTYAIEWFNPDTSSLAGSGSDLLSVMASHTTAGGEITVDSTTTVNFGSGTANPNPYGCAGGASPFRCDVVLYLKETSGTGVPGCPFDPDRINWDAEVVSVIKGTDFLGCDESTTVSVTLRNLGTKVWNRDNVTLDSSLLPSDLALARVIDAENAGWRDITTDELATINVIDLITDDHIECNETVTFDIPLYRDEVLGDSVTFDSFWRILVQDDAIDTNPFPNNPPGNLRPGLMMGEVAQYSMSHGCAASQCSNGVVPTTLFDAQVLSVITDDPVKCGMTTNVTVEVQNTGELSWLNTPGSNNSFGLDTFNGSVFTERAYLPNGTEVGCGDIYTFQYQSQMPVDLVSGSDISTWSMLRENGPGFFGNNATHQVTVECDPDIPVPDLIPAPMYCLAGPIAHNDLAAVQGTQQLVFDLSANDESPVAIDFQVVITGGSCTNNGLFEHHGDGIISFTPNQGSAGQCTVDYELISSGFAASAATLNIDILAAPLSQIDLVVHYLPDIDSTPEVLTVSDEIPVDLDFYYDESLGSFEHKTGAECAFEAPNPGYLRLSIQGAPGSELISCMFTKVLDGVPSASATSCLQGFNNELSVIINTNSLKRSQSGNCGLLHGLQGLMSVGADAQFKIEFQQVGSDVIETRQINVNKKSPQLSYPDVHQVHNVTERIEVEDYDIGGQGVSFLDSTVEPSAWLREGGYEDAVDMFQIQSGQVIIHHTTDGEWTEYTRMVTQSGAYELRIWANRGNDLGDPVPEVQVEVNGTPLLAEAFRINEMGWQVYETTVELTAAIEPQVFKLSFVTGGANINWMSFTPLDVNQGINITQQPVPVEQSVQAGTTISYIIMADNNGLPIDYQWYKDDIVIDDNSSAMTSVLNLGAVDHEDAGAYKVMLVSDGQTVTSSTVTLMVIYPDLMITEHPQSLELLVNEEAKLDVSVTGGEGPYSYQWYKRVNDTDILISGASEYQLFFPAVQESDEGMYFVTVDSNDGQQVISDSAEITVNSEVDAIDDVYLINPDEVPGQEIIPGDIVHIRADRFILNNDLPVGEVVLDDDTQNPSFKNFTVNGSLFNNRKQNVSYRIEHRDFPELNDSAIIEVFHNTPLTQTDYVVACEDGIPINPLIINVVDLLTNDKPQDRLKITDVTGANYDVATGTISYTVSSNFCGDPNAREEINYSATLDVDWIPSVDNPTEAQTVIETVNVVSQAPIVAVDLDYLINYSETAVRFNVLGEVIFDQVINPKELELEFAEFNIQNSHGTLWSGLGMANLFYNPDEDFWSRGYSIFTYTVKEKHGNFTSSAQIRLLAAPDTFDDIYIAQTPSVGDLLQQQINIPAIELLHNDRPVGDVTLLGVQDGSHGSAELSDGEIIYSPSSQFWLTGYDELTYQATLDHQLPGIAEAKITLIADYAFIAGDDAYGDYPFGSNPIADLALNDWPLDLSEAVIPLLGQTSQFGGSISFQGSSNQNWGYTPPGGSGVFPVQGYDSFEYRAEINLQNEIPEQVTGQVWLYAHDIPALIANPDMVSMVSGATELIIPTNQLLLNDVGDDILFSNMVRPPLYGRVFVGLNGTLRYIPNQGSNGIDQLDSFTYQIINSQGRKSLPALVEIKAIDFNLFNDIVLIENQANELSIIPSMLIQNDLPYDQITVQAEVNDTQYATMGIARGEPSIQDNFVFQYFPGNSFWLRGWDQFNYFAVADNLPHIDEKSAVVTVVSEPTNVEHVFADSVEDRLLERWSVIESGGGQVSVMSEAAIAGEYGVSMQINGYEQKAYITDNTPDDETDYQAQFLFNPNNINTGNSTVALLRLTGNAGLALQIRVRSKPIGYEIIMDVWNNENQRFSTAWLPIENHSQLIHLDYKSSTADLGLAGLKVENQSRVEINDLTNDLKSINSVKIGAVNLSTESVLCSLFIDDFRSWRK